MANGDSKVINDNLLGRIELSNLELEIVSTPAFLRLGNITQLGLAYLVFPGATHRRLSHSLGVMHLVGQIADKIDLSYAEYRRLRAAALLHDIGQYPLSHCIEIAYRMIAHRESLAGVMENPDELGLAASTLQRAGLQSTKKGRAADDKRMGAFVIRQRDDLRTAFKNGLPRGGEELLEDVAELVGGEGTDPLSQALLDSDYDCDRLDYVQRDSLMSGVPYGHVDLEFLIENMDWRYFPEQSRERVLAVRKRPGLAALEHYLLSRYYMYSQVYFHKTVRGFELLAKAIFLHLAARGFAFESYQDIQRVVPSDEFVKFNDTYFFERLAAYVGTTGAADDTVVLIERLLRRRPLKLAFEERIITDDERRGSYRHTLAVLTNPANLEQIAARAGLLPQEIIVDRVPAIELVPFRSEYPTHQHLLEAVRRVMDGGHFEAGAVPKAPWLYDDDEGLSLLATDEGSLLRDLRDKKLLLLRVYTTREGEDDVRKLARAIRTEIGR